MFRFLFFVLGICFGFAAAVVMLPLPGKTFFNRMSKLPVGVKNLVNNGIDLSLSFYRLAFGIAKNVSKKIGETIDESKLKLKEIEARYSSQEEINKTKEEVEV